MKKKSMLFILTGIMALSLCACGETGDSPVTSQAPSAAPSAAASAEASGEASAEVSTEASASTATADASASEESSDGDALMKFIEPGMSDEVYNDDQYYDRLITLNSDKTYTIEQWSSETESGVWDTFSEDEYTLYSPTSDENTGINAPLYDIQKSKKDDSYILMPEGSDESGYTKLLDTSADDGSAMLDYMKSQLSDITGYNEDSVFTTKAYVTYDTADDNGTYAKVDDIVWLTTDEPELCKLYGVDPSQISDDYQIVNNTDDSFSYRIDENTKCSHIPDAVSPVDCTYKEMISDLKSRKEPMLAEVTVNSTSIESIKEIYVP